MRRGRLTSGSKVLRAYWSRAGTISMFGALPRSLFIKCTHILCRAAAQRGPRHYEFPTGYNTYFGPERFNVGELYFSHSPQLVVRIAGANKPFPNYIDNIRIGFKPYAPEGGSSVDLIRACCMRSRHPAGPPRQHRPHWRRQHALRFRRPPERRAAAERLSREC